MLKIKDIGEVNLIDRITRKVKNRDVLVGIGDDAAIIRYGKKLQVLTTDCLVEGDHFRCDWFKPVQIGMKAIEINVSDIAAMGGNPRYALISLGLKEDLPVDFVEELYRGMWKACDKYCIDIVGGNMTHSNQIFISVTLVGEVKEKNLTLRSCAKAGDLIFLSGPVGNGRAGLRLFQNGVEGFDGIKKRYLEPKARLDFASKIAPFVNSMIDVSDGLASEIMHICKNSKCGAKIYMDKIPIREDVREVARILNENEYDYALYGGEDFELLYTVSKENINKIDGYLIGEITKNREIKIVSYGKEEKLTRFGYDHFSRDID